MNKDICGLLIASGYSGRMKRLKALLDIGGVSFVTSIALKLSLVCNKVVVVLGHEKDLIAEHLNRELDGLMKSESSTLKTAAEQTLDKLEISVNENYSKGMFTSLQKGLSNASEYNWVLYHFVDQPGIPKSFYFDFTDRIETACRWVQPVYGEQSGHPLLLSNSLFDSIINSEEDKSLRDILAVFNDGRCRWSCDYPEILEDIDTAEDYNIAESRGYSLIDDLLV